MKTPLLLALVITSLAGTLRAQQSTEAPVAEPAPAATAAPTVVQAEDTATLESKIGSEVIVEGFVKDVGQTSGGGITFINFGDRKTGFTAAAGLAGAFFVARAVTAAAGLPTLRAPDFLADALTGCFLAGCFLADVLERMTDLTP